MRRTPRTHLVRRSAAAAVAVLALGGLTACNDDSPTATDEPSEAVETTESSEPPASEEPEAEESLDPATFVDDVLGAMTDLTTAHMSMTMEGGPMGMSMEGDIDYTSTPPNMAMTMTNAMLGKGEMQVRMVDGVMYMQMPQLGDGKWIKMDMKGAGSPLSGDMLDQMDPGASLEMMKDAVTDVEYVGEEDVDGETLKHYTMTVRSDAVQDLQEELGTSGAQLPKVITYDLWTDADGMMRQTTMAMGDLGSVTIKLSNWGEPVEIEAPPKSEVMEMPGGMSMNGSA